MNGEWKHTEWRLHVDCGRLILHRRREDWMLASFIGGTDIVTAPTPADAVARTAARLRGHGFFDEAAAIEAVALPDALASEQPVLYEIGEEIR